jgi:hypothetical protein
MVGAAVSGGATSAHVDVVVGCIDTGWTGRAAPHAPPISTAIPSTVLLMTARRSPMRGGFATDGERSSRLV